jgi:hypothetical protein
MELALMLEKMQNAFGKLYLVRFGSIAADPFCARASRCPPFPQ